MSTLTSRIWWFAGSSILSFVILILSLFEANEQVAWRELSGFSFGFLFALLLNELAELWQCYYLRIQEDWKNIAIALFCESIVTAFYFGVLNTPIPGVEDIRLVLFFLFSFTPALIILVYRVVSLIRALPLIVCRHTTPTAILRTENKV